VTSDTDITISDWPKRMRGGQATRYLREVHGLPIEEKTLRNKRCAGLGPRCKYFGSIPLYERSDLDTWAEGGALTERPANRRQPQQKAA
jgi:hypothetical protein